MNETTEQFDFSEEEVNYTKICVDITVYWRGSVFDKADSVIEFYNRALDEVRTELKFFTTGSMSGAKNLRSDSLEMVPYWFRDPKHRRDIYRMRLESGVHANEPSNHAITVVANETRDERVGLAQLCLPVDYISETPERLLNLMKKLTDGADFESGHAGYSLNWDHLGEHAFDVKQKMGGIAGRYLGVDLFNHIVTLVAMRKTTPSGFKCVNWLTLLGTSLTERVGGMAKLQSNLSPQCDVHGLSNGVIISAGDRPTMGDRNHQAELAPYRSVGKVLAPLRFVDHRPFFGSGAGQTARWLARFDG